MKLRSVQFVLLVLLVSSLSLSEGSPLRLADELMVSATSIRLTSGTACRPIAPADPATPGDATRAAHCLLPPASRDTLARTWPMPHPAAQAVALQATTANARA